MMRDLVWFSEGRIGWSDAQLMSHEDRVNWLKYIRDYYDHQKDREVFRQEKI